MKKRINEFETWIIDDLKRHIQDGMSVSSYRGKYLIKASEFRRWLKEIPEMREINFHYKLKVDAKRHFPGYRV